MTISTSVAVGAAGCGRGLKSMSALLARRSTQGSFLKCRSRCIDQPAAFSVSSCTCCSALALALVFSCKANANWYCCNFCVAEAWCSSCICAGWRPSWMGAPEMCSCRLFLGFASTLFLRWKECPPALALLVAAAPILANSSPRVRKSNCVTSCTLAQDSRVNAPFFVRDKVKLNLLGSLMTSPAAALALPPSFLWGRPLGLFLGFRRCGPGAVAAFATDLKRFRS